jgi:hypothetical protein
MVRQAGRRQRFFQRLSQTNNSMGKYRCSHFPKIESTWRNNTLWLLRYLFCSRSLDLATLSAIE